MAHEVPASTPELSRRILDTAEARGLSVSYLNFSRVDVGVMFEPTPTAAQVLLWFDDLEAEALDDREYPSAVSRGYDRVLSATLDDEKLVVWVQPTGEERAELAAEHARGDHFGDIDGCPTCEDLAQRRAAAQRVPGDPTRLRMVDVVDECPR